MRVGIISTLNGAVRSSVEFYSDPSAANQNRGQRVYRSELRAIRAFAAHCPTRTAVSSKVLDAGLILA